ncbi:MAG: MFS transporter [Firmicutes bacterium]|nr:MFS transporter [Bacillota bacterium]
MPKQGLQKGMVEELASKGNSRGKNRWLIWFVLAISFAVVHFQRISLSVVTDELMSQFNITALQLGLLNSLYFYIYAFGQLPAGTSSDLFGLRNTITAGLLVMGLGSVFFGTATSLRALFLTRLLIGLGSSVIWVSLLKAVSLSFSQDQFASITGLSSFIGHGGQVLASAPLSLLVALVGWRFPFIGLGFLTLLLALAAWRLVGKEKKERRRLGLGDILWRPIQATLKNPANLLSFLILFGLVGSFSATVGLWGVPYLVQVGEMAREKAAGLMMIMIVGRVLGPPISGFLTQWWGRPKPVFLLFAGSHAILWCILVVVYQLSPPSGLYAPLFFSIGFFNGIAVQIFSLVKDSNAQAIIGTANGFVNSGGFVGTAIIQLLMGYLLDSNWEGGVELGVRIYPQLAFRRAFYVPLFFSLLSLRACYVLLGQYKDKVGERVAG